MIQSAKSATFFFDAFRRLADVLVTASPQHSCKLQTEVNQVASFPVVNDLLQAECLLAGPKKRPEVAQLVHQKKRHVY